MLFFLSVAPQHIIFMEHTKKVLYTCAVLMIFFVGVVNV